MFLSNQKALSAPVTTCAPAKPCPTCTCSNTFVIDAQQALLSAPMEPLTPQARTSPSLPPAGVKIADRVYLGGSPTGESLVELYDHPDHNITLFSLSESIKTSAVHLFPEVGIGLTCILKSYYLILTIRDKAESLKYSLWPRSATLCLFLFRIKSHRVKLNMNIVKLVKKVLLGTCQICSL